MIDMSVYLTAAVGQTWCNQFLCLKKSNGPTNGNLMYCLGSIESKWNTSNHGNPPVRLRAPIGPTGRNSLVCVRAYIVQGIMQYLVRI